MIALPRETLRRLGVPALTAVVLVGMGIVALALADQLVKRADAELDRAKADKASALKKLSQVTEEEREIGEKLVDYQRLRERGIVGEENRLDWVEAIKAIKAERRLYDLRYKIEARKPIDYPTFKSTGDVEFMVSRMRLDALLLHEDDLIGLVNDLPMRLAPYVSIRSCRVERTDQGRPLTVPGPRLRSECVVDLITVRDRESTAVKSMKVGR